MEIKYTVVIPHKNSLHLLKRCIEAIPVRNDIEVIVIDDNSILHEVPDETLLNNRLGHILNLSEGTGAGAARNMGVSKSKGKWLLFADADDFFTDVAFDQFDKATLKGNDIDIFYFKVESRYSDTLEKADRDRLINQLIERFDSNNNPTELRLKHLVPWGKLFNANYIKKNGFQFDTTGVANDVMFSVKAGLNALNIDVVKECVYCVTQGYGSLTNTTSKQNNRQRLWVALSYNKFVQSKGFGRYRTSVRPFIFNAKKFGLLEIFKCLKLINEMGGGLFYNLNIVRSAKSLLSIREREKSNKKYIVKK